MAKKTSKSKAQEALANQLADIYPYATILQETYIGKLVESQGYSIEEIAKELGRRPHKMFVDILIQDSEMTVACEYNGEQHYHQVGNMTSTSVDVLMNQQLDEEKAWILQRIGIPIVTVAYDTYLDESVFDNMVSDAYAEMEDFLSSYYICDECGRQFPESQIKMGVCETCRQKHIEEVEEYSRQNKSQNRFHASDSEEWKKQQKELAKQKRKEAYRKWKESPEYLAQKEKQKQERKKRNAELKEKRKAERRKMKEAQKNKGEDY